MSRPHRGGFESWLRGGQTVGHTFDMTIEVLGKLLLLVVAPLTLVVGWAAVHHLTPDEQLAGMEEVEAGLLGTVGRPLTQRLSIKAADGTVHVDNVRDVGRDPDVAPYASGFWRTARITLMLWTGLILLVGLVANLWFQLSGQDKIKARQIRGQIVQPLSQLLAQIRAFNAAEAKRKGLSDFQAPMLCGVPYPFGTEHEHTLIVGAPGSGKSVVFHGLIDSIRAKGQRAIIFDPELDYIRHHYDPERDVILNPFDARSPAWSPFHDARDSPDWAKLGHAIFKDPKSGDPYWVNVARSLFAWTGYQLMERQRRANAAAGPGSAAEVQLTEALDFLFGPIAELKALLKGTPAAMHLGGLEGARISSLLSVLAEGVEPLIYLHGDRPRFSIRDWVNPPGGDVGGGGFLFLSAPESHMDALRPLLGFWSELAISTLLSRQDGVDRETTWFLLDEFHSAGRVDALADGPQRLRKYGGAVVLGFQQVSQLHDLYGPDKARTIIGNCLTKLILRAGDFETATLMSEQLGRRVMRRVDENTSYGANSIRDGVGLMPPSTPASSSADGSRLMMVTAWSPNNSQAQCAVGQAAAQDLQTALEQLQRAGPMTVAELIKTWRLCRKRRRPLREPCCRTSVSAGMISIAGSFARPSSLSPSCSFGSDAEVVLQPSEPHIMSFLKPARRAGRVLLVRIPDSLRPLAESGFGHFHSGSPRTGEPRPQYHD